MINHRSITKADFEQLFHTWNRKVYQYALSKTSSPYIAEETVQRVFIKLWDNLSNKQVAIKLEAQLFCITRTVLLDVIKEERRRQLAAPAQEQHLSSSPTPLDLYRLKEMQLQLDQIIEKMPEARKKVFQLSRFEQLSYKEIAQRLSITPKTVENHIHLALKVIKKAFFIFLINMFTFI
ncbi:sigma-70 family RNA polymerase sigma factor [Sphingobacterium sp. SRCM116780]|uniref:sigma-70 family RNA polymerase sigma factor n=1 Tax=Sphingobacterium sp. SRCM116780 TaxID=2907623 RepID=UPI001F1F0853|nr:sigma-70 family RNA polymerase sigma factor [Sphingobacterium sp. SRCM116780]UIR54747.1 sigma-70 family RNA polymerase sigma factor [Sphingobacterium sp. SRCM116780]